MNAEQVVVTGLGMTTPLGGDVRATWQALLEGRSGVQTMPGAEFAELPVRIGALLASEPAVELSPVEQRRWDRTQQLAVLAARQSWHDAGFDDVAEANGLDPGRVGAVVGTGIGGLTTILQRHDAFLARGWTALSPFTVTMTMPNGPAATVCLEFGVRGGVHAPVGACAAGAEAIGHAVAMIRSGQVDVVLAGGTEAAIHPLTIAGFAAMRALSRRNDDPPGASRPFDVERDGFVLGEGAAMLVLESAKHAAGRGVDIYAEVIGVGISSDPTHLVRTDPGGLGAQLAMGRALLDADAAAEQVVHVNAHATGTPLGDVAEARAITAVLGDEVVVTSTKSMTGHLLGAAGALEAIVAILALRDRVAPPTINLERPDRGIELRIPTGEPYALPSDAGGRPPLVMSNSFGFGGHCVSLLLGPA